MDKKTNVTRCFVSIGSNIDREKNITSGLTSLKATFGEIRLSGIYESDPVGFEGQPFFNLVVSFNSNFDVGSTYQSLRQIEIANGRLPESKKFSSRALDLDLLLYGELIIDSDNLQLPRRDIEEYAFVLQPLAELAPSLKHPKLKLTFAEMWQKMAINAPKQLRLNINLI